MKIGLVALFTLLIITGCTNDNFKQYRSLVAEEPASGKHADSLFAGIYLGMTSKDFYVHCWQLNKAGLFTDGENNHAVLYQLNNGELKHNASMNFYPEFLNGRIYKLQATFNYDAWAPWNKSMMADSLQQDVLKLFAKWYPAGNPFLRIEDKERGVIYVKVDGNRRILVGKYDDMRVKVDYTDLLTDQASNTKVK
jgi:hypothetical protein